LIWQRFAACTVVDDLQRFRALGRVAQSVNPAHDERAVGRVIVGEEGKRHRGLRQELRFDFNVALGREFQRVADKIAQELTQPSPITLPES
jgi:hypothetical protein